MDVYDGDVGWFDSGWVDVGYTYISKAADAFHSLPVTDKIDAASIVDLISKPRSIKIDLPPIGEDGSNIELYRIFFDFRPTEHKCEVYAEAGNCKHYLT